jgi:hypothetical protein
MTSMTQAAERPWTWGLRLETSAPTRRAIHPQRLVPRLDVDARSANSEKSNSNAVLRAAPSAAIVAICTISVSPNS